MGEAWGRKEKERKIDRRTERDVAAFSTTAQVPEDLLVCAAIVHEGGDGIGRITAPVQRMDCPPSRHAHTQTRVEQQQQHR